MQNYAYYYAVIDLETMMCINVMDTTRYADPEEYPDHIAIPEPNGDYLFKYYNPEDGNFYYDAEYTEIFDPNAK
jgi:hypothetical protein